MKRVIVLMLMVFLCFSVSGFSMDNSHKNVQSVKTDGPKKVQDKKGKTPRKLTPKKRVHKPAPKHHGRSKQGSKIGI
jgi:hypothetical protein